MTARTFQPIRPTEGRCTQQEMVRQTYEPSFVTSLDSRLERKAEWDRANAGQWGRRTNGSTSRLHTTWHHWKAKSAPCAPCVPPSCNQGASAAATCWPPSAGGRRCDRDDVWRA
jgi:hypothetical protein